MHLVHMCKEDKLWSVTTLFWYLTVFSSFFMAYLFPVELPIGGHFFLYRLALPVTALLYGVWCIKGRYNPLKGIALIEKCVLLLLSSMLLYGMASFFWAISKGAWFSQMLSTGMDFCFLYLAIQFYKDDRTRKGTVLLACATMLFCCLGGLIEMSCGCFFDTPYAGTSFYYFMGKLWQAPVFCFYNQNGLSASAFWVLIVGFLYLFDRWNDLTARKKHRFWNVGVAVICICLFLFCAAGSRLTLWAIPFFLVGLACWLLLRYKRGLLAFVAIACCFLFIYVGENYTNIKEQLAYVAELNRWQESVESGTAAGEAPKKPTPTTPSHTTTGHTVPVDKESGQVSIVADESGGLRVNLMKNALNLIADSKCLGVGVGNLEIRMAEYDNVRGMVNPHCFVVEVIAEFGIFALLPLLALGFVLCKNWFKNILQSVQQKDRVLLSNVVFQIFAVLTYPFLSTINSSSWGMSPMWLFLAYIVWGNCLQNTGKPVLSKEAE